MKKITILAAVVALLGSCAQNTEDTINPNTKAEGRTIYAKFDNEEEETKTYVENYKYLRWHAGDEISFFDATTHNNQYAFAGNDGDAEGEFNAVATGEGTAIATTYGVYPYNANTSISEEGVISVELPANQAYGVNSFGKGANTMVAVGESATDDKLFFKNACGYLVVKLYNESGATVKSVVLKGNNEEKIAGAATIAATHTGVPSVTMADTATTAATIDCGEGVEIGTTAETATELWFALPEITFEGGITITATDTEGKEYEKTTTKPVVITRNNVQPMKALGAEFKATKPANNEIWYTATEKVEPKYGNGFGANYMAEKSTFNSSTGNGIMVFDGDITSLGQSEFYNNQALTSITLPPSIISIPYENVSNATFGWCTNLKEFKGKFASEDGRSLIIDDVLIAIAPSGLTSFSIPSGIKTIASYAFAYYDQIVSVNIPYGVETIGNSAFYKAVGLKSISIPRSVKEIKAYAFYLATALETIEFIDGNYSSSRTIGVSAFESCTSLKELTIPQGVTEIPQSMCHNCTSLTTITLPNSISTINSYSLNCTNLETVCCLKTTAPTLYSNAFGYSTPSALKIYVDSSALSSYKSSWSAYKDRIFDKEILKHQPVDLGLSVLWSSCNLYGREYDESDLYGWYDSFDGKCGFEWSSVDPATAMLGDKWRVPTKAEWEELLANCKVYFSTESYASHLVVESKVNGNKIYLPAGEPGDLDYYGCSRYWSSSANNSSSAHGFYFYLSLSDDGSTAYKYMTTYSKTTKCLIRPVYTQ